MKPTEQPRLVLSTQYTRCGALHPLRGAAPDQKRCNAHGSGAAPKATSTFADAQSHQSSADEHTTTPHKHCTRCGALNPLSGAAPFTSRCTRYGALHPLWGAAPDQKRCNAHGSGAAPKATSTFADAQSHQSSADEHTTTPTSTAPFTSRYTRCGALHPIRRGAMPTDRVQRHFQQALSRTRNHTNHQPRSTPPKHCTLYVALHPMWGAAPDVGRYTRCGALHPIRRGVMPTDRVQRPTQQAFSRTRATHLIPHRHTRCPHLGHLPLRV